MAKITAEQCVRALKEIKQSYPAKNIAVWVGSDSRAVATALREPVRDGRVTITYRKGIGWYRFIRLTAKKGGAA